MMSWLRDKLHTIWYWINVKTWVQVITFISIDQTISGMENVPRKGPFILVSNHLNNADPPIITAFMPAHRLDGEERAIRHPSDRHFLPPVWAYFGAQI